MSLLVDLFGYFEIVLHALVIVAQSMTLGGVLFLVFLLRPFVERLAGAADLEKRITRVTQYSALGLIGIQLAGMALQMVTLMTTAGLPLSDVLRASFAIAGLAKVCATMLLMLCLSRRASRRLAWDVIALILCAAELAAATFTTHAYARLDDNTLLLTVEGLHQFGAAIWVGGIPCFLIALRQMNSSEDWRLIGTRFSRMSMIGVASIVISGAVMSVFYVGSMQGFYGTTYGLLIAAKILMFLALLVLGFGNFLVTERLRKKQDTSVTRLRRFAEVEIGIGFTIFFAAASLTSVPAAVDLSSDRVSLHELVTHNAPMWPQRSSPRHEQLAIPQRQLQLNDEAAREHRPAETANVPGADTPPPRNAQDIAWSQYNHHWAGIAVMLMGLLALLHRRGVRWARNWPLLFFPLAAFLFVRADPETWPMGDEGFWIAWRDPEVAQHRFFIVLILLMGVFEWMVGTKRLRHPKAACVFPLLVAAGSAMLLTQNPSTDDIKAQFFGVLTQIPIALAGLSAACSRWLELRLPGRGGRVAGWVWPICFMLAGMILLWYREA